MIFVIFIRSQVFIHTHTQNKIPTIMWSSHLRIIEPFWEWIKTGEKKWTQNWSRDVIFYIQIATIILGFYFYCQPHKTSLYHMFRIKPSLEDLEKEELIEKKKQIKKYGFTVFEIKLIWWYTDKTRHKSRNYIKKLRTFYLPNTSHYSMHFEQILPFDRFDKIFYTFLRVCLS